MEIILNVVYGGNNLAESTTAPIVREVRRMLKKSFYSFENEAVKQIKLFLLFNGNITSYCDSTGVYQSKYFSKKKEFVANLCFDDKKWSGNKLEDATFFLSELVKLLLQCGVLLRLKLGKINYPFNMDDYERCIDIKNCITLA